MALNDPSTRNEIKLANWEVQEEPLHSNIPVIGSLIAWFRNGVNSIATKWYVRSILQQQNHLNRRLSDQAAQLQLQLSDQDHEISIITHDLAELRNQIIQMNQVLKAMEEILVQPDSAKTNDDSK